MRWWRTILAWYYRHDFGAEEGRHLARLGLIPRYHRITRLLYKPWLTRPTVISIEEVTANAELITDQIARVRAVTGDTEWLVSLEGQLDLVLGELNPETANQAQIEGLWARLIEIDRVLSGDSDGRPLTWVSGSPRKPDRPSFANLEEAGLAMEEANRQSIAAFNEAKRLTEELTVAREAGQSELGELEVAVEKAKIVFVAARSNAASLDREVQFMVQKHRICEQAKALRESLRTSFDEISKHHVQIAQSQGESKERKRREG